MKKIEVKVRYLFEGTYTVSEMTAMKHAQW